MRRDRIIPAAVALVALVGPGVLAGCSSGDPDVAGPTTTTIELAENQPRKACSLLDKAAVEAEGVTVTSGPTQNEDTTTDECDAELAPAEGADPPIAQRLIVVVYSEEQASQLKPEAYEDAEPVAGVGAESWASPSRKAQWVVLDDGRVLSVQFDTTSDTAAAMDHVNAWAKAAAAQA